ncbi:phospholipid phosphatase-related protein type 1-like, partial [Oppia nitens]|uniref:phospholipid phosphatase-related protein type 1-like n=1 Tax=Oppia nitens TaxID=1686743 RepID=UPI0023DBA934
KKTTGAFAYGLLVTSILTDTLKLVTGRLRPYFLTVCQTIHEICKRLSLENTGIDYETRAPVNYRHVWVDPTDFPDTVLCQNQTSIIRSARMSFPSGTASLSTYSALFIVLYITYAWTARSSRVFKLWFTVTSVICLLIVCAGKVTTHDNHWDDIVAGLVIGIGFALYICYTQLNLFSDLLVSGGSGSGDQPISDTLENQSQMTDDEDDGQWFWRYFHIPRVNLLRRSARYFRKRTAEPNIGCGTGMSSMTPRLGSNSSYVNPAFDHKDHIMDTAGTGGCGGSSSSSSRPHSAYIDTYRRH